MLFFAIFGKKLNLLKRLKDYKSVQLANKRVNVLK